MHRRNAKRFGGKIRQSRTRRERKRLRDTEICLSQSRRDLAALLDGWRLQQSLKAQRAHKRSAFSAALRETRQPRDLKLASSRDSLSPAQTPRRANALKTASSPLEARRRFFTTSEALGQLATGGQRPIRMGVARPEALQELSKAAESGAPGRLVNARASSPRGFDRRASFSPLVTPPP